MKYLANIITTIRILLALVILYFLQLKELFQIMGIILIPLMMLLDFFDGVIARKTKSSSLLGSVYDISADRFIEFIFFVFFAIKGVCGFVVPLIIICRGLIIDAIRSIALVHGKTAFGANSLHQQRWTQFLTGSKFSRGTYNTLKTLVFMLMGLQFISHLTTTGVMFISILIWITVGWSLLRAVPVLHDGYKLIKYSID